MNNDHIVEQAIEEIRAGKIVILTDDEDRENEGDFIQASECVTPQSVNFMISHGKGLLCQTITTERARELNLDPQVAENTSLHETAFTVSVDAVHGTTTGISASDRARTIQCMVDENAKPEDLGRPGHIFPIVAKDGGVLARQGHTEGSVELARLAGKKPNAIICEILNEEGEAARGEELKVIAKKFDLLIVTIKDLVAYVQRRA